MANSIGFASEYGLENHGIYNVNTIYWSLPTPSLYELAIQRREGLLAHLGPLVVRTGHHTGRSPRDKFIVREESSENEIWWGEINQPISPEKFNNLYDRLMGYLQGRDVFVQDVYAGADPEYTIPIRAITEYAWHSLFARNMFVRHSLEEPEHMVPEFTVIHTPRFHAIPELDSTNSEVFIILNMEKRVAIIGGTSYAGELKKSVFTYMNYILPKQGVLSMHCSANMGPRGDVALFFGLSGTGKTTLSSDPERRLIGDDEHGWSDHGVFNIEGGCYAKVIRLSEEDEPQIYQTTRRFGTILENVYIDSATRRVDLDSNLLTENTRASYPLSHIPGSVPEEMGGHPKNIFFLSADAFGVLPPISRLTPEQAMYYFLSGYTAKVAGTETGLSSEPSATFSTCFAAPFLPLPPTRYAELLGEKIKKHKANVWLINTGWVGGPYGVGSRIKIRYTRAMLRAAISGELDNVEMKKDPIFGLNVPTRCPGVPSEVLNQRTLWKDPSAYDAKARGLAENFRKNFRQFEGNASKEVVAAGPQG